MNGKYINGPDYYNICLNDMFYCLDRLCNDIYNYTANNTLSEEDYYINIVVNKLEVASCQAVSGLKTTVCRQMLINFK